MKRWDQSAVGSLRHYARDVSDAAYFTLDCRGTQCCVDGSGMHELTSDNSSSIRSHPGQVREIGGRARARARPGHAHGVGHRMAKNTRRDALVVVYAPSENGCVIILQVSIINHIFM